jgi:hypothetical protein
MTTASEPTHVSLSDITTLPELRMRLLVREDKIAEYKCRIDDGSMPPPLELVRLPDGRLVLVNGEHRYHALNRAGRTEVACVITDGTLNDAIIQAAGADNDAPLNRTTEDKKHALRKLLSIPEVADSWSVRRIMETLQVYRKLVVETADEMYPGWSTRERNLTVERNGTTFQLRASTSPRRPSVNEALGEPEPEDDPDDPLDIPDTGQTAPPPVSSGPAYTYNGSGQFRRQSTDHHTGGSTGRHANGYQPWEAEQEPGIQTVPSVVHVPEGVDPGVITILWENADGTDDSVSLGTPSAGLRIPPDVRQAIIAILQER